MEIGYFSFFHKSMYEFSIANLLICEFNKIYGKIMEKLEENNTAVNNESR